MHHNFLVNKTRNTTTKVIYKALAKTLLQISNVRKILIRIIVSLQILTVVIIAQQIECFTFSSTNNITKDINQQYNYVLYKGQSH